MFELTRFLAWINVIPEKESRPRYETAVRTKFPDDLEQHYLIDYFKILVQAAERISFTELKNFQSLTGNILTPFEAETLVEMGGIYRGFLQHAREPGCENPLMNEVEVAERKMKSLKAHMQSLRKGK